MIGRLVGWLKRLFVVERHDDGMFPEDENGAW